MRIGFIFWGIFMFISTVQGNASEMVLNGTYRGKNVYVRNPFNPALDSFCVRKVWVNDNLLFENPRASAIQIDLSYLRYGDIVVIRIDFAEGCRPEILNPEVLQLKGAFKFLSTQANNNAIEWVTQGELAGGTFMVEQEVLDNKMWVWKELTEVDGKGNILRNQYSVSPRHLPGENKYRIRYQPPVGESEAIYSLEVVYTSTENPITFYPLVVTNKITFSESTDYSITDRNGKVVKQGTGKVLFVQEIRPGEYFLHFQNQTEKFVKK